MYFIIVDNIFYLYYCHLGDIFLHSMVSVGSMWFHLCISKTKHRICDTVGAQKYIFCEKKILARPILSR